MQKKTANVGLCGLGRLGQHHAINLAKNCSNTNLVAVCSNLDEHLNWAKNTLLIDRLYKSFDEMCNQKDIDAIVIASPTALHPEHIITALEAGKHVFCEKPVALELADCLRVKKVADQHPDQICCIGFMRRYDPSLRRAKEKIDNGEIGDIVLLNCQSGDMDETAEFQLKFAEKSGGMYLDFIIHDYDMIHWLTGKKIKKIYAVGGAYIYKGFAKFDDVDNITVVCTLEDNSMATIMGTRNTFHGHSTSQMIRGSKGELWVSRINNIDSVEVFDKHGARIECKKTFYELFEKAFKTELYEFVDHVIKNTKPEITLDDAIYATKIGIACRKSYLENQPVEIID